MSDSFYKRMRPLIDRAAENAKRLASTSSWNPAYLWTVFFNEKNRLSWTAIRLETEERVQPDRWSKPMTREEFEEYLLSLGVWVEEPEDGDDAAEATGKI